MARFICLISPALAASSLLFEAEVEDTDQGKPPEGPGVRGDIIPFQPGVIGIPPWVLSPNPLPTEILGVFGPPSLASDPQPGVGGCPLSSKPTRVGRFLMGCGIGGDWINVAFRTGIWGLNRALALARAMASGDNTGGDGRGEVDLV